MTLTATLQALHSKRDRNGNVYWALRFIDHSTGREIVGTVSGRESNVYGILRVWNPALDDWDRSIRYEVLELSIREFNRTVKDWPHAGCTSVELTEFIRAGL